MKLYYYPDIYDYNLVIDVSETHPSDKPRTMEKIPMVDVIVTFYRKHKTEIAMQAKETVSCMSDGSLATCSFLAMNQWKPLKELSIKEIWDAGSRSPLGGRLFYDYEKDPKFQVVNNALVGFCNSHFIPSKEKMDSIDEATEGEARITLSNGLSVASYGQHSNRNYKCYEIWVKSVEGRQMILDFSVVGVERLLEDEWLDDNANRHVFKIPYHGNLKECISQAVRLIEATNSVEMFSLYNAMLQHLENNQFPGVDDALTQVLDIVLPVHKGTLTNNFDEAKHNDLVSNYRFFYGGTTVLLQIAKSKLRFDPKRQEGTLWLDFKFKYSGIHERTQQIQVHEKPDGSFAYSFTYAQGKPYETCREALEVYAIVNHPCDDEWVDAYPQFHSSQEFEHLVIAIERAVNEFFHPDKNSLTNEIDEGIGGLLGSYINAEKFALPAYTGASFATARIGDKHRSDQSDYDEVNVLFRSVARPLTRFEMDFDFDQSGAFRWYCCGSHHDVTAVPDVGSNWLFQALSDVQLVSIADDNFRMTLLREVEISKFKELGDLIVQRLSVNKETTLGNTSIDEAAWTVIEKPAIWRSDYTASHWAGRFPLEVQFLISQYSTKTTTTSKLTTVTFSVEIVESEEPITSSDPGTYLIDGVSYDASVNLSVELHSPNSTDIPFEADIYDDRPLKEIFRDLVNKLIKDNSVEVQTVSPQLSVLLQRIDTGVMDEKLASYDTKLRNDILKIPHKAGIDNIDEGVKIRVFNQDFDLSDFNEKVSWDEIPVGELYRGLYNSSTVVIKAGPQHFYRDGDNLARTYPIVPVTAFIRRPASKKHMDSIDEAQESFPHVPISEFSILAKLGEIPIGTFFMRALDSAGNVRGDLVYCKHVNSDDWFSKVAAWDSTSGKFVPSVGFKYIMQSELVFVMPSDKVDMTNIDESTITVFGQQVDPNDFNVTLPWSDVALGELYRQTENQFICKKNSDLTYVCTPSSDGVERVYHYGHPPSTVFVRQVNKKNMTDIDESIPANDH